MPVSDLVLHLPQGRAARRVGALQERPASSPIFTLGSPIGWRTAEGLIIGEQVDRISQLYGKLTWNVCIGYGAMTMRTDAAVTSIYTTGQAVYGFALSRPNEPVCN